MIEQVNDRTGDTIDDPGILDFEGIADSGFFEPSD